jgi:hypothetical protein
MSFDPYEERHWFAASVLVSLTMPSNQLSLVAARSGWRWAASIVRGGFLCALCLAAVGCAKNEYKPPPPPRVEVATPDVETVQEYHYYTGTTEASKSVEVRARVQGYL